MSIFSDRLIESRERMGITQKRLADLLEITSSRLNYWEKGKREPDVLMIKKISSTLNVSPSYLIGLTDDYILRNSDDDIDLNEFESEHIKKYRSISDDGKTLINNILNFICENELDLTRAKMYEVSEEEFEYVQKIREFNEPSQEFIHNRIDDIYKKRDTFLVPEEKREAK